MLATWRNVAYFRPDRANLATWFLVCRHTFVLRFSNIDVPRTDEIQLSVLLIPTSNVDLHNCSPQQNAKKNHPPPSSPRVVSSPLAASLPSHPLCLFVPSFVCSFGWLLRRLSAPCCCVPSRRRVTLLRYFSSLVVCLVVVESSRLVSPRRCIAPPDASRHARFV